MQKTRENGLYAKLAYNILYINGEPQKLKQLRETEIIYYTNKEKENTRRRTYSKRSPKGDTNEEA